MKVKLGNPFFGKGCYVDLTNTQSTSNRPVGSQAVSRAKLETSRNSEGTLATIASDTLVNNTTQLQASKAAVRTAMRTQRSTRGSRSQLKRARTRRSSTDAEAGQCGSCRGSCLLKSEAPKNRARKQDGPRRNAADRLLRRSERTKKRRRSMKRVRSVGCCLIAAFAITAIAAATASAAEGRKSVGV